MMNWLRRKLYALADSRPPDFIIGRPGVPYMRRWWVIPRNRWFNLYLHNILHDDEDRALHDHPWFNCSIILSGGYVEHHRKGATIWKSGSVIFRSPWSAHRLSLLNCGPNDPVVQTWTLFITGPVMREWGFLCPQGWRPWREFVSSADTGQIGRGCDD
jgi:hypothetical protein